MGFLMRIFTALVFSLLLASSASALANFEGIPGRDRDERASAPTTPEPAAVAVFGVGAVIIGYALHRRQPK